MHTWFPYCVQSTKLSVKLPSDFYCHGNKIQNLAWMPKPPGVFSFASPSILTFITPSILTAPLPS